jgi:hypothetical protein
VFSVRVKILAIGENGPIALENGTVNAFSLPS